MTPWRNMARIHNKDSGTFLSPLCFPETETQATAPVGKIPFISLLKTAKGFLTVCTEQMNPGVGLAAKISR